MTRGGKPIKLQVAQNHGLGVARQLPHDGEELML